MAFGRLADGVIKGRHCVVSWAELGGLKES